MDIEIKTPEGWTKAATISLLDSERHGTLTPCQFEYDIQYAINALEMENTTGAFAVSCHLDVDLSLKKLEKWPAFLMDLFPQGAALKYVVEHLRIPDLSANYWNILNTAVLNPPGNIRIANQTEFEESKMGFDREEVVIKGPAFVEHMVKCGAPVSGTTGAAGAAPKFLLREDLNGKFHADGSLSDKNTKQCWIIKYPRGDRSESMNRHILKAEKTWYDIATEVGLRTGKELHWENDCLFIPRFDRLIKDNDIDYLGLESFYSLVDSLEFGSRFQHSTYLDALARFSTQKNQDLIEYLLRDILNMVMGNTDNHGRNQSVIKTTTEISLSPLYDFAPMVFDPEGIPRNTRWRNEEDFLSEAFLLLTKKHQVPENEIKNAIESMWNKMKSISFDDKNFLPKFLPFIEKNIQKMDRHIEDFIRKYS